MESQRHQEIIGLILKNSPLSISELRKNLSENISIPTLNRELAKIKSNNIIQTIGQGPSQKYIINLNGLTTCAIDLDVFFKSEIENRTILEKFNMNVFDKLDNIDVFSPSEHELLTKAQVNYSNKTAELSIQQFKKEFERLMIELSWKSSQIEGNTYDLLETEQLLKHNISSENKTIEETQMLLNHKSAINYTFENKDLYDEISISKIVDIHLLLTKKMGIAKNFRKRIVRITGTNYLPPDSEFIIQEAMERLCVLLNSKKNIYEKALLAVLLISYIQPFEDGNKRTARLLANAILMNSNICPLSYRSSLPIDYKKAVLIFYELNNINAFKKIFIQQFLFATDNYF
jgi:DNA-binding Lrp family transcriptional regulator